MNESTQQGEDRRIECSASDGFVSWIAQAGGSLAVTTYQAGKVALVGWNGSQMGLIMRDFPKPMGLAVRGQRLALACRHEIWMLANAPLLAPDYAAAPGIYDALFVPRVVYQTGDLHVHDLAFDARTLWLVNTRFSCLAGLSKDFSFVPRWQPSFISELAPEDRCHLNGLAMQNDRPKYVTALGESDNPGGWRPNKGNGGIVIDIDSGEIVLRGLSMPHSPRWHDGRLWLLNSGSGELCTVELAQQSLTTICELPGYLRGLCFVGRYAVVGLCQARERRHFDNLPVKQRQQGQLICGVAVVDLGTGQEVGRLGFTSGCEELYDIQFLPGVFCGNILNLQREASRHAVTAPAFSYWLQPSE